MSTLRAYRLLLVWQALRLKTFLPLAMLVQGLFALGIVIGYPLLFPELDRGTILYLATGAPAVTLITMGVVLVPQVIAQAKLEGTLDYMRTLPVPRLAQLFADLTVWLVVILPGVLFAVAVGAIRFGPDLTVSPLVAPAMFLVVLTATAIGYAIASLLPPLLAGLLTQVLVVFVLMFSPLNFPIERLPDWLASIHRFLPFQATGEVIRGTLASTTFPVGAAPFLLLAAWGLGGLLVTHHVLNRRG